MLRGRENDENARIILIARVVGYLFDEGSSDICEVLLNTIVSRC